METMWKIIKTGRGHKLGVPSMKINDNPVIIANTFNKYFTSVTGSIISSVRSGNSDNENNLILQNIYLIALSIHSQMSNGKKVKVTL
jgi:hypothetical protein